MQVIDATRAHAVATGRRYQARVSRDMPEATLGGIAVDAVTRYADRDAMFDGRTRWT